MPAEVEGHERHARRHSFGNHGLDQDFGAFGAVDPDVLSVLDAQVVGVDDEPVIDQTLRKLQVLTDRLDA